MLALDQNILDQADPDGQNAMSFTIVGHKMDENAARGSDGWVIIPLRDHSRLVLTCSVEGWYSAMVASERSQGIKSSMYSRVCHLSRY